MIALAAFSEGRVVNRIAAAAFISPIAYLSSATSPLLQILSAGNVDDVSQLILSIV